MKRSHMLIQILFLLVVIFFIGFYVGVSVEENKMSEVNDYFVQSEVSLVDILALNSLILGDTSCVDLEKANYELLDRVYDEAVLLEDFEGIERVSQNLESFHKKYDVLRTYLWISSMKIKEKCNSDFSTIVYLYNYNEKDLTKRAEQNSFSKILYEVKQEKREDLFLIPIAYDSNLISIDSLISKYEIESFPVVILDEESVLYELNSSEEVLALLN